MFKQLIIYGGLLSIAFLLLKFLEISSFNKALNWDFAICVLITLFFGLGFWFSQSLKLQERVLTENSIHTNLSKQSLLSNRELEVIQGMANGLSNKEIAEQLFLSENTIKTHASNIYFKLAVKRRTQAIQKAKEMAFIA